MRSNSHPEGGRVDISLQSLGSHVELLVKDTGKGIHNAFMPHVFDRFRQEDCTIARPKGGLGLGLTIVRALLEQHRGSIRAESAGEGKGTTFTILLPIAKTNAGRISTDPGKIEGEPKVFPELNGLKILVVDDEADTREAVAIILKMWRAEVRTVASASDALRAIEKEVPDILLSDLGLPGEDGFSLIRKVRMLHPSRGGLIPAVALTAFAGISEANLSVKSGFQAHVSKPVEPNTLAQVIVKVMKRHLENPARSA